MKQRNYDYEWLGYALLLTYGDDERLIQGEEASELYDALDAITTDSLLQDAISDYFV